MESQEKKVVESKPEEIKTEDKQRITPELVNSVDVAIRVLMSAAELGYKKGLFEDMTDVASIDKARRMAERFVSVESFKVRNYNQILKEYLNDSGTPVTERVQLLSIAETFEIGLTVETFVIPSHSDTINYFMFLNGDIIKLSEGQKVMKINGQHLIPGIDPNTVKSDPTELKVVEPEVIDESEPGSK